MMNKNMPYFKTSLWLGPLDNYLDPVNFQISEEDGFLIWREASPPGADEHGGYPGQPGFDVSLELEDAMKLRDFLNHALPTNNGAI